MAGRLADPRIVIFACSWYPLTAADNAGADGCEYGPSATIVPVDCGGCVTTAAILTAFSGRADGVLIAVCGRGDCHYANGSESCEETVREARELMALSGLDPARLRLEQSSSVDGSGFASLVREFAAEVRLKDAGRSRPTKTASKAVRKRTSRARRVPAKVGAKRKPRGRSTRRGGRRAAP